MKSKKINTLFSAVKLLSLLILVSVFAGCKDDDEDAKPALEYSTMVDIDGNTYKTIKIGDQWWMAENLKVTKFKDGTAIPSVGTDAQSWVSTQSGYCEYANSSNPPGLLYNFGVVTNPAGIAPYGWRVPTDDDWKQLERSLGMAADQADRTSWRGSIEGEKMKLAGISGWELYENVWATNESGFSAEAGSCRLFDGNFGSPGLRYTGFWWSSSEYDQNEAWYRHLDYKERGVFRYHGNKKYGFSIRCVKN